MPSMNTGMQRRIGLLPKTEDLLDYQGHIFGNTHRGFGGRKPTPTQEGFFGIGGIGMANGDGMSNAWYGNDSLAQDPLPVAGTYGIGSADAAAMSPDMMAASSYMKNKPANYDAPGLFGLGEVSDALVKHQSLVAVLGLGMVMYMMR